MQGNTVKACIRIVQNKVFIFSTIMADYIHSLSRTTSVEVASESEPRASRWTAADAIIPNGHPCSSIGQSGDLLLCDISIPSFRTYP